MSIISIPNTFSAGAVIVASQHNSNFSTIYSDYNGNIDNTNVVSNAAIAYSKLNLTGNIVNADISASAAIVDSKLAQITTAAKVSGTAITGLASLPSGAGIIPAANLPSLGAVSFVSNTAMAAVASSGDIAITAGNVYLVEFNIPTLGSDDFIILRFNNDTGSNYQYIVRGFNFSTTAINANSVSTTSIALGGQLTTSGGSATPANGYFYIFQQAANATKTIAVSGRVNGTDHTANVTSYYDVNGLWTGNAVVTSFRFLCSGGSNLTGNIYLYKISLS